MTACSSSLRRSRLWLLARRQLAPLLVGIACIPAACHANGTPVILASPEVVPTIVADADLHKPLAASLADLRRCLGTMSGRDAAPLATDAAPLTTPAVIIARHAERAPGVSASEISELGLEAFIIRTGPTGVVIAARTLAGAQHGIYELLHGLGCRWFFPGETWEDIPRSKTVTFPTTSVTVGPSFNSRHIWYGWGAVRQARADYRDWCRRNRQGGWLQGSIGHAYARIADPKRDFEKHPEWFPFWDGERHPSGQLCLSNKQLQKRGIEYVRSSFRGNSNQVLVSLSPNDGRGYCKCTECAAMGTTSDQTLVFANVIAQAVNAEFPGRYLGMYAYSDNCAPPTVTGHPNVIVYVATRFIKSGHTVDQLLDGWSKKASQLGIRDYYDVIIWSRDMTRWRVNRLRERIPYYHSLGVSAISAEASCNWAPQGLNYYIAARLMWDHKTDVDSALAEFYRSWGPAAEPMQRYFERWRKTVIAKPKPPPLGLLVLMQDLEEAAALAAEDPVVQKRVDLFRLYLHWVLLYKRHRKASSEDLQRTAREAFHLSWRLGPTSMVHSYGQFRERRMWRLPKSFSLREINRWKMTDEPLPVAPPLSANGIEDVLLDNDEVIGLDEPDDSQPKPKPFFTHADVDALLAADIARLDGAAKKH